jgi:hypothetical protein
MHRIIPVADLAESYSTLRGPTHRLHHLVGYILGDVSPERRTHTGREAVVKPCPDARVRHFRREVIEIRPVMCMGVLSSGCQVASRSVAGLSLRSALRIAVTGRQNS